MTRIDAARESMDRAQGLLDSVHDDLRRLEEFESWLREAGERVKALGDYINGPVTADLAAVVAQDPAAVTPPVTNEDAAWEALADFDRGMMRVLRLVTAELTSSLDD